MNTIMLVRLMFRHIQVLKEINSVFIYWPGMCSSKCIQKGINGIYTLDRFMFGHKQDCERNLTYTLYVMHFFPSVLDVILYPKLFWHS